jgi:hypothetical protein
MEFDYNNDLMILAVDEQKIFLKDIGVLAWQIRERDNPSTLIPSRESAIAEAILFFAYQSLGLPLDPFYGQRDSLQDVLDMAAFSKSELVKIYENPKLEISIGYTEKTPQFLLKELDKFKGKIFVNPLTPELAD